VWQVIGHDKIVYLLRHSLEKGTLAHAYLLVGPPHVGKMTLALNIAQALNCESDEPPCGECAACQKIASDKHADVRIVSLTSNGNSERTKPQTEISIDQVREVQRSASLPPFEGRYKVFIIDEAEFMSNEAANCLLKTLEEPVDNVVFVLLTTNEELLPLTVISRCQRLELPPLTITEIEAALSNRGVIEPQKKALLARLSHGCPGWAFAAAGDDSLLNQRSEQIDRALGIINTDHEERFQYAAQLATQFSKSRETVQQILDLWLDYWRDLMLIKAGCQGGITNIDFADTLVKMAEDYSLTQITGLINSLQAAKEQLRQNANPQLVLEVLMLSIPRKEGRRGQNTTAQFSVKYG
jgi:DNA polymerase-3 subunit delta'